MSFLDGLEGLLGSAANDYPFIYVWVGSILFLACSLNLFQLFASIFKRVGGWR